MIQVDRIALLAAVRKKTGEQIVMRVGEELLAVNISDDQVMVLIRTVQLEPLARGFKVVCTGTKLIIITRDEEVWTRDTQVAWDEPDTPYELDSFGGLTPEEYAERRAFEDDCYRPGNGSRLGQRDSSDRVFQGYDYSKPTFYTTTSKER